MTETIDTANLRALAEIIIAADGPIWWIEQDFRAVKEVLDATIDDARFVAAANPTTILALLDRLAAAEARNATLTDDAARNLDAAKMMSRTVHDMVVANQAAWIEWQHGKGAEAAMSWVHNGLWGPGHIPDEDAPYGKEPQAFYDANCAEPLPQCFCGRPSNIMWMGQGFCSNEHYGTGKARAAASISTKGDGP